MASHQITSLYGKPLTFLTDHAREGLLYLNQEDVRQWPFYNQVQFPKVGPTGDQAHFLRAADFVKPAGDGSAQTHSLGSVNTLEAIANRLNEQRERGGAAVKLEARGNAALAEEPLDMGCRARQRVRPAARQNIGRKPVL